ncbi:heavy metal translocating P-type ATPase [Phyllobacterium sp. K27]
MTKKLSTAGVGERLGFHVDGMDCASCVGKIETALGRMGGISDVAVNFATETLSFSRDPASKTTAKDIAKKIRSLGFDVTALPASATPLMQAERGHSHAGGCSGNHDHDHDQGKKDPSSGCGTDGHKHDHDHNHEHDHHHGHDHDHDGGDCSGHSHAAQAPVPHTDANSLPNVSMRIEGMDCASCVGKIEVALARINDVSDVRVNFTTEMLQLTLATNSVTKVSDIEKMIKSLGFGVSETRQLSSSFDAGHDVELEAATVPPMRNQSWWQTRKGRHVVALGLLMGSAYAIAQFIPLYAEWIFAAAVVAGVIPFARKAFALAVSGSPFSIETLMSVAAVGALVIGEAEEAAAVVFLFAVGELLESVAAGRARAGIKALASLVPKTAVLLDPNGGQRGIAAASLRVNDLVLVRPGDRVPADGQIILGTSSLDESAVTGESMPREKAKGDSIFAGSINVDGVLQVRVEKTAADNTISRIIHLVEQAQSSKAPTARFIEKFSRYYTPAVMLMLL